MISKEYIAELIKFSKKLKVLYVEDNDGARDSTIELLKMFFDDIAIAIDGEDGLEQYSKGNFDLIITDINMPKKNGLEMISKIRESDDDISILILTAFEDSNYLLESIQYSVDGYLLKPIETSIFIQTISKIIHKLKLEKENIRYKKELHDLIEKQKQTIDDQEKIMYQQSKMASMGEMIDSIAHQWKQPLSTISINAQNFIMQYELFGELSKEDAYETNKRIQHQIKHMISTMDEFRNFFRPDIKPQKVLLKEIVESVLVLVKNDLQKYNVELIANCTCDIEVNIIPNEFKHILINLINNAKDAFKDDQKDKKIIVEPQNDDEYHILKVKDNAGGIPNEIMDHIFEANFTTKENSGGTGIGLYMSKMIIEKIGGTLEVYNEDNGAVFLIKIPKKDSFILS